ncbi:MAG: IS66 family insertion sequence element accessory protein TnpA, partial [Segetibacter sp.]
MQSKEQIQRQMFDRIDQWQQSGLSQKAFCEQVNLSYHIFHYWYK